MRDVAARAGVPVVALIMLLGFLEGTAVAGDVRQLFAKVVNSGAWEYRPVPATIREIKDETTVERLMKIVEERRDDWELQIVAMRLLGEIANPLAADLLMKVMNDDSFTADCPALKWNAITALGNFRNDSRIVYALLYKLEREDFFLKEAIIRSLGEIGDRRTLPALIAALDDKSLTVRLSAVKALGRIRDRRAYPFLAGAATGDTDPVIREEAEKALEELE
ncbi:MAG: HEAT repeat domain-containing protein [Nitrospirae bacterium]|nr:HEAT repeat domain-containing protein [Nitrospirota bacterium]